MKENVFQLLIAGFDINYKRLTACTIYRRGKPNYQVDCNDFKKQFSELFKDPIDAVNKFFELKKEVYEKA